MKPLDLKDSAVILIMLLFSLYLSSQGCIIELKIIDNTDKTPLDYVSVSFQLPEKKTWDMEFTDGSGLFTTIQRNGVEIKYNLAYLGYQEQSLIIYCENDSKLSYIIELSKSAVKLDEVIIIDKFPAIIEKRDTVIYSVSEFVSGNEEKLKEVLNKLPGIHVDRNNEVTFKGEKVRELLVENDKFFTGDPGLAVKYIPADAVERVEVLEKYNNIKALSNTSINDRLTINIKLKKDKKKLIFGELIAGTNISDRHVLHNSAFYYSPSFTANNISDYKSTSDEVLTSKELFRILSPDIDNYDPKTRSASFQQITQLYNLLGSGLSYDQSGIFGVQQLRYRLKNKWMVDAIILGFDKRNQSSVLRLVTFPDRATDNQYSYQNSQYNLLHKHADINLSTSTENMYYLTYNFIYSESNSNNSESSSTNFSMLSNTLNMGTTQNNRRIQHRVKYIQQWSKKLQSILIFNHTTQNYLKDGSWDATGLFIPTLYNLSSEKVGIRKNERTDALNIYTLARLNYNFNFKSKAQVFIRYESSNQFINNEVDGRNSNSSPIEPFRKLDKFTGSAEFTFFNLAGRGSYIFSDRINDLNMGIDFQHLSYQHIERAPFKTGRFSPFIDVSRNLNKVGKMSFVYQFDYALPTFNQINPLYTVSQFTVFSLGRSELLPEQKHSFTLSLFKSKSVQGKSQNMSLNYSKILMPIITEFNFENLNIIETFYNSHQARNDFSLHIVLNRMANKFKIFNHFLINYAHFYQRVQNDEALFKQYNFVHKISFSKELKNVELSCNISNSIRNIPLNNQSAVWVFQPAISTDLKYFLHKNWLIQTEAEYITLISKNLNQTTIPLNMQLHFKTNNEKYKIKLVTNNILDQRNQATTRVDIFSSTITNQRIFPRYFYASFVFIY